MATLEAYTSQHEIYKYYSEILSLLKHCTGWSAAPEVFYDEYLNSHHFCARTEFAKISLDVGIVMEIALQYYDNAEDAHACLNIF